MERIGSESVCSAKSSICAQKGEQGGSTLVELVECLVMRGGLMRAQKKKGKRGGIESRSFIAC